MFSVSFIVHGLRPLLTVLQPTQYQLCLVMNDGVFKTWLSTWNTVHHWKAWRVRHTKM